MERPTRAILVSVLVLGLLVSGIGCAAIDAGHEGVLVEQPFFFGHGGVDPVPSKTGRVWVAPTTHVIDVDVRPVQYSEHFDIISAENAPVSFDAFLIANVVEGRSPELIARYGPSWYQQNVKEAFRTFVREEVQKYPLFQLTTDPTTRTKLQEAIAREVQTKLIEKQTIPVRLNRVVVGSILPPKGVVEQTTQTIIQEQRKITMVEFQKAEEAREKAEKQRGIADRAYRESLGLDGARICRPAAHRSAEGNRPTFAVRSDRNHGSGKVRHQPAANRGGEISPGVSGVITGLNLENGEVEPCGRAPPLPAVLFGLRNGRTPQGN